MKVYIKLLLRVITAVIFTPIIFIITFKLTLELAFIVFPMSGGEIVPYLLVLSFVPLIYLYKELLK